MSEQHHNVLLLNQLKCGSIKAFDELYQRYYSFVMQICISTVSDYMEAEEICHDVFLDIIRKADSYHPSRGTVEAWITVIAKSKSKDLLRKKLRRSTIFHHYTEELQATSPLTPETTTIKKFERAELHKAVKQLPDNQQRALIASYIENKTHQECAANWQVPLGTVKSWIRYGLNNLRKQFKHMDLELHDT